MKDKTPARLITACLVLSAALLVAFPGFAAVGYWRSGSQGIAAAAVAGGVCWFGAMGALLLVGLLRGREAAVHATLLSMVFRLGIPLAIGLLLNQAQGELARAGVLGMILCYYLWALVVETLLSLWVVRSVGDSVAKAS